MNCIRFPVGILPGFEMRVADEAPPLVRIVCSGALDALDSAPRLQPELFRLHAALVENHFTTVRLEMQAVDYMNSSGIKCFMAWFLKAEQSRETYAIELVYDPDVTWQYVSFTTMGRIAPRTLRMFPLSRQKSG